MRDTLQSPTPSPYEDMDDDNLGSVEQWQPQEHAGDSHATSPSQVTATAGDQTAKPSAPTQKRRRVTRACDECRRKKIKCCGKQPCTHCTVYSYECTYDQPSNRRRNPAPQYIEALEQRLHKAEAILKTILPGVDLDDSKYDARGIDQIIESSKNVNAANTSNSEKGDEDAQLQSMVENTGSLDLDDQGHWDYHGQSSGVSFLRKMRAQFGNLNVALPPPRSPTNKRPFFQLLDSPKSASSSPYDPHLAPSLDLPKKEVAKELCRNALDDACALMRFIHQPSFYQKFDRIFEVEPENYTNADVQFLPLLYEVIALGCMFAQNDGTSLDIKGYESATEQGYQYFQAGRQMIDITDCRDLMTIQTVCMMINFLQATAKLSTCYSYVGIALRACCRLGLHRNLNANFNPIEREERKRAFWLVRKMDSYVGAMMGLPQMLQDEDFDQEFPTEVDDEYITPTGIQPMPPNHFSLITASNAHARLTCIQRKVVRFIYPVKGAKLQRVGNSYTISHGTIRELERELQMWMDELPMELRPSNDAPRDVSRVQQLLRIAYAHVQMKLYHPFLHYVSHVFEHKGVDKRSFACAAACLSVTRNIVHITSEMKRRGLLIGAYWFVMYTTYFAILSLVFFVVENPDTPTSQETLKDAMEGRETLASLAKRSMAADRCTKSLNNVFNDLPEKLKSRENPPESLSKSRKRGLEQGNHSAPDVLLNDRVNEASQIHNRVSILTNNPTFNITKRTSLPDPPHDAAISDDVIYQGPSSSARKTWSVGSISNMPTPESTREAQQAPNLGNPRFGQTSEQSGNPNLPDLRQVMFPSDNPFAYPNQSISTLEESQFALLGDQGDVTYGMGNTSTEGQRMQSSYDNLNPAFFGGNLAQTYQQNGRLSAPVGGNTEAFGMPQQMDSGDLAAAGLGFGDGFWKQVEPRGKTGMTPGVNLDDLFGAEGWGSVWGDQAYGRQ